MHIIYPPANHHIVFINCFYCKKRLHFEILNLIYRSPPKWGLDYFELYPIRYSFT